ncbi:hypothetical protein HYH02_003653 [Chlamydomonas schloesseri]|uniref:Uncharacterized protein n=1 Tax=Chlamydomonas schloesseri TaxID=2026947 RepID=A0A835WR81_9CHLO|nr:hypothetical protein HYH02_003653 [Chlamydomonas schloesseri]|eukprot:KAG2451878.1 hypothetical protein HYH02_003653 [Chlamydomonas schloesseri]
MPPSLPCLLGGLLAHLQLGTSSSAEPDPSHARSLFTYSLGCSLLAAAAVYIIVRAHQQRAENARAQNCPAPACAASASAGSGAVTASVSRPSAQAAADALVSAVPLLKQRESFSSDCSGSGAPAQTPLEAMPPYRAYYSSALGSRGAGQPHVDLVLAAEPDVAVCREPPSSSDDAASFSFPVLPLAHPCTPPVPRHAAPASAAAGRPASGAKRGSVSANSSCSNSGSLPPAVSDIPPGKKGRIEASGGARARRRFPAACSADAAAATAALELASQAYAARVAPLNNATTGGTASAAAAGAGGPPAFPYVPQRPALAALLAVGGEVELATGPESYPPSGGPVMGSKAGAFLNAKLAHHEMPSLAHFNQALQLTRQLGGLVAYPSPYARGRSAYKVPRGEPGDAPAGWRDQIEGALVNSARGLAAPGPDSDGPDANQRVAGLAAGAAGCEGSAAQAVAAAEAPGDGLRLDAAYLRRGCILVVLEYSLRRARGGLLLPSRRQQQQQHQSLQGGSGPGGAAAVQQPGLWPEHAARAVAVAEIQEDEAGEAAVWPGGGATGGGALPEWHPPALSQQQLTAAFGVELVPPGALVVHSSGDGDGNTLTLGAARGGSDDEVVLAQHYTGPTGSEALWLPRQPPLAAPAGAPAERGSAGTGGGDELHGCRAEGAEPVAALALQGAGPCILATQAGQAPVQLVALARGVLAAGVSAKQPQVLARCGRGQAAPVRCGVRVLGPHAHAAATGAVSASNPSTADDDLLDDAATRRTGAPSSSSGALPHVATAPARGTAVATLQPAASVHSQSPAGVGSPELADVCSLQLTLPPCPRPGLLLLEVELDPERDAVTAGPSRAAAAPLLSPVLPLVVIDNSAVKVELNALAAAAAAADARAPGAAAAHTVSPVAAPDASLPGWFRSFLYDFGSFLDLLRACRQTDGDVAEAAEALGSGGCAQGVDVGCGGFARMVDMSVASWLEGRSVPEDAGVVTEDVGGASTMCRVLRCDSGSLGPQADQEPRGSRGPGATEADYEEAAAAKEEASPGGGPQGTRPSWQPGMTDGGSSWLSSAAEDDHIQTLDELPQPPPVQQVAQQAARPASGAQAVRAAPGSHIMQANAERAARELLQLPGDGPAAKAAPENEPSAAAVAAAGELLYVAAGIAAYACRQGLAATLSYVLDAVAGLGPELLAAAAAAELGRKPAAVSAAGGAGGALEAEAVAEAEAALLSHSPLLVLDAAVAAQCGGVGLGHLAMQSGNTDVLTALLMHAREPEGGSPRDGGTDRPALPANAVASVGRGLDCEWLRLAALSECTALFVRPGPGGTTALHLAALMQDRPEGHEAAQLLLSLCPLAAHAWFEARDSGGLSAAEYALRVGASELNEQCRELLGMEALEAVSLGDAGGAVHALTAAALITARNLAARTSARILLEAELPLLQDPGRLHRTSVASLVAMAGATDLNSASGYSPPTSSGASRSSREEARTSHAISQQSQQPDQLQLLQYLQQQKRVEQPLQLSQETALPSASPLCTPPSPLAQRQPLPVVSQLWQRLLVAAATTPWAAPFRGFADSQLEAAFQQWAGGLALSRNQLQVAFFVLFLVSNSYKALCVEGLRGLPLLIALGPVINLLGPLAVALWRLRGGLRHDLALAAATQARNAFVAAAHLLQLPHPQPFEVADVVMQEALTGLHHCVIQPIMDQPTTPAVVLLTMAGNRALEAVLLQAHGVAGRALVATLVGRTLANLVVWYTLAVWSRVSFLAGVTRRRAAALVDSTAGVRGGGGASRSLPPMGTCPDASHAGKQHVACNEFNPTNKKYN